MSGASLHFAARGWVLAVMLVILIAARIHSDTPLRPEWLVYVGAAILLRLWAGAHLGDHGNTARAEAERLVSSGPYRLSRNPLYVSNILAAAGLILFANALPIAVAIALIIAVVIHHVVLVFHEERSLRALHGAAYADYVANTPRWYGLPRPRSGSEESVAGGGSLATALTRQGRNVAYTLVCVLILWIAARW
jgi:protein-S-isoprenylcysteine O-methyltransferase Ste14